MKIATLCVEVRMRGQLFIWVIFSTFLFGTGCESGECREPRDLQESSKNFDKRIHSWLDEAKAYDLQREKVFEERQKLLPQRHHLVRQREALMSQMIDTFIQKVPDRTRLMSLVKTTQQESMVYGWKLFDVGFSIQKHFTTEQRQKLAEAMQGPREPFKTPFLARRAIDYVLFKISATGDQKTAVAQAVSTAETKVNALMKNQYKLTDSIMAEWIKQDSDLDRARRDVQAASDGVASFAIVMIGDALILSKRFDDEQKAFINDRLRRMKVCPAS